jgi:hypothetical protein
MASPCTPGIPCWYTGTSPVVYKTYPQGCSTSENSTSPFTLPMGSDNIYYSGANLASSGTNTYDLLTVALQKIDAKIDPATMLAAIIAIINTNATLKAALCTALTDCP